MSSDFSTLKQTHPWLFLSNTLSIDILYDIEEPEEETNERETSAGQDTINTAKELASALSSLGHSIKLVPVDHKTFKEVIASLNGDIIFNQVEEDELGFEVLLLLEGLHKPVTGVDSYGFKLSWDKSKIKELLIASNVPTPKYFTLNPKDKIELKNNLNYPVFVKAADDHGSLSINEKSVIQNQEELINQVNWIRETIGGPALIEEYIEGRELQVTVLGNGSKLITLPVKEIIFGGEFTNKPKIVTYKAKWETKSLDYLGTTIMECPAKLSIDQQQAIETAVKKASEALKVRDYSRFDIRLEGNTPFIIDYNANPAIGPNDASALPAKVFGLDYPQFIASIISIALERYQS